MMFKLFYITLILLVTNSSLFGQTSSASATATIVTPVGVELPDNINEEISKSNIKTAATHNTETGKIENASFLKIIGETFSHNVIVENIIVKRKKATERSAATEQELFTSITVNFD